MRTPRRTLNADTRTAMRAKRVRESVRFQGSSTNEMLDLNIRKDVGRYGGYYQRYKIKVAEIARRKDSNARTTVVSQKRRSWPNSIFRITLCLNEGFFARFVAKFTYSAAVRAIVSVTPKRFKIALAWRCRAYWPAIVTMGSPQLTASRDDLPPDQPGGSRKISEISSKLK